MTKRPVKRLAGGVALVLGIAGLMACAAGAYGVWRVQVRLNRANQSVYDIVDTGLTAIQERVPVARERVRRSKITADDLGAVVRRMASDETRERVMSSLEIESRAANLAGYLQAADARLDASATILQNIRQVSELTDVLGAATRATASGQAQETIARLRATLEEALAVVSDVQKFAADGGGPVEGRFLQITTALARIALTLSDVDGRLDDFDKRLSDIRDDAQQRRDRRDRQIGVAGLVSWVLLGWIALAQIALGAWGWKQRAVIPAGGSPR